MSLGIMGVLKPLNTIDSDVMHEGFKRVGPTVGHVISKTLVSRTAMLRILGVFFAVQLLIIMHLYTNKVCFIARSVRPTAPIKSI